MEHWPEAVLEVKAKVAMLVKANLEYPANLVQYLFA